MLYQVTPASLALMAVLGLAAASEDMVINFPGMLRGRAPAMPGKRATITPTGPNMQTFTQALGGAVADPITQTGNSTFPFAVNGDTFNNFLTAATRSCNNQHNACAAIANGPNGGGGGGGSGTKGLTVNQCDTQQSACIAQQQNVVITTSAPITVQATTAASVAATAAVSVQAITEAPAVQATTAPVVVEATTAAPAAVASADVGLNQTLKSADADFFYICDV